MTVVSDAGPIIALARIEQLALLPAVYGRIVIPPAVGREVFGEEEERAGASALAAADWMRTKAVQDRTAVALLRERLDAGESEAIVLALQLGAEVVLMDEARGRRIAAARGLTLTGTLGTLVFAKRRGHIERAAPLLDELAASGFRMSDALYQKVLEQAGEA